MRWLEAGHEADAFVRPALDDLDAVARERPPVALAVTVPGETDPSRLPAHLNRLASITVVFGGFRDGRGFSLASILRERGYRGELRAAGDLIADHAPMLARCGFDAVELPLGASVADWERQLTSLGEVYQPAADGAATVWTKRAAAAAAKPRTTREIAAEFDAEVRDLPAEQIVAKALERFPGRIALLSSFGTEAAVGLHMLARIDPNAPVLFIDTDRHFHPTLQYRDRLVEQLGLTNVEVLKPKDAAERDPKGDLWRTDADACCALRKVEPLSAVDARFDAMLTGRKRMHGGGRLRLPVAEAVGEQIRISPLANWSGDMIAAYFARHGLPEHPLVQAGYRSIGCWPCTRPSSQDEDARAGRWSGLDKDECGIHMPDRWVAAIEQRRAS